MRIDELLKMANSLAMNDNYLKELINDYEMEKSKDLKEAMQKDIVDYTQEILCTKELK